VVSKMARQSFTPSLERAGPAAVVCLIGELDLATAPRLAPTADELRARPVTKLVLDLRQLSFLDAAGVAPLVELAVSLAESGCATVAVGASPQQELILGMTPIALGRDADLDRERIDGRGPSAAEEDGAA
jgi:anti-anti-sigma factor